MGPRNGSDKIPDRLGKVVVQRKVIDTELPIEKRKGGVASRGVFLATIFREEFHAPGLSLEQIPQYGTELVWRGLARATRECLDLAHIEGLRLDEVGCRDDDVQMIVGKKKDILAMV